MPFSSASHADTRSSKVARRPLIAMVKYYHIRTSKVQKPSFLLDHVDSASYKMRNPHESKISAKMARLARTVRHKALSEIRNLRPAPAITTRPGQRPRGNDPGPGPGLSRCVATRWCRAA